MGVATHLCARSSLLRKFNNEVVWVLPLTRRQKPGNPYYVTCDYSAFPEVEDAPLDPVTVAGARHQTLAIQDWHGASPDIRVDKRKDQAVLA
jgi:hypothetical protein